jgi:hypothetical protein
MFATKSQRGRNWRLLSFRFVAALITLAFVAIAGAEFIQAWVLRDPAESVHLWHIAELVALIGILLGGTLLSLMHKPQDKPLLAQFFVISMILCSIGIMPFEIKAGALLIIMVLFLATYPSFRALLSFSRQGPFSLSLLWFSLLLTFLLAPIAWRELQWQIIGMAERDAHALALHWIGSVMLIVLLVLAGLLSATRRPGWHVLGIITGITYSYLGVTAMILQDSFAGSWSGGYGLITIIAGVWYILISLRGGYMLREAERTRAFASEQVELPKRSDEIGTSMAVGDVPFVTRTVPLPEMRELMEAHY